MSLGNYLFLNKTIFFYFWQHTSTFHDSFTLGDTVVCIYPWCIPYSRTNFNFLTYIHIYVTMQWYDN